MAASAQFITALADRGAALVTHWGLVNAAGTELSGGTYARVAGQAVNSSGTVRPPSDLTFNVPAGSVVAGWRGFNGSTGGTNYGGGDLTQESYAGAGTYVLTASLTGYPIVAG